MTQALVAQATNDTTFHCQRRPGEPALGGERRGLQGQLLPLPEKAFIPSLNWGAVERTWPRVYPLVPMSGQASSRLGGKELSGMAVCSVVCSKE